jgi:hypothetical protein
MDDEAIHRALIVDVVLRERQGRDRGWWDQMLACYHDDAMIDLNWYQGTPAGFVEASRQQHDAGRRATHRLSPPIVRIRGGRAVAETGCALETRNVIDDIECDLTSYMRLLSRVERRGGSWRLASLGVVYERDTLTPVIPGRAPAIDTDLLDSLRPAYRFLAYVQIRLGWPSRPDLPGDDQPDLVKALYDATLDWLEHTPTP